MFGSGTHSFTAGVPFPLASGYTMQVVIMKLTILSLVRSLSPTQMMGIAVPSRNLSFNMLIILKLLVLRILDLTEMMYT